MSRAVKAPRWKSSSMRAGALATTAAAPRSTVQPARTRSRSTRSLARSVSPAASARATTGKVTVQSMSESTMGICATFCA
ncbi:hypothetical protein SALBM135S_09603 [Streptomyces alboniger]